MLCADAPTRLEVHLCKLRSINAYTAAQIVSHMHSHKLSLATFADSHLDAAFLAATVCPSLQQHQADAIVKELKTEVTWEAPANCVERSDVVVERSATAIAGHLTNCSNERATVPEVQDTAAAPSIKACSMQLADDWAFDAVDATAAVAARMPNGIARHSRAREQSVCNRPLQQRITEAQHAHHSESDKPALNGPANEVRQRSNRGRCS